MSYVSSSIKINETLPTDTYPVSLVAVVRRYASVWSITTGAVVANFPHFARISALRFVKYVPIS